MLIRTALKHRHAFQVTHVKTQGQVKGTLSVLHDLASHLRQGIFSEPGKTDHVAAPYANEPVFLPADQAPGPRGLAVNVFGVHGQRLEVVDSSVPTLDFFFNDAPMIELTDIDTCLYIMQLREKYFDDPATLKAKTVEDGRFKVDYPQHAAKGENGANELLHAERVQIWWFLRAYGLVSSVE